jgi:hypothetical protein
MRAHSLIAAVALGFAVAASGGAPSLEAVERVECFALELDTPVEGRSAHVGFAKLTRTEVGDETLLEWDLHFVEEDVRVLHVERVGLAGAKLVWREMTAGRGRTVLAELASDSATLRVIDWASVREREDVHVVSGALLPLGCLELVRRGELCDGVQPVFDPLSRALEPLSTETRYEGAPVAGESDAWKLEREVEASRTDGTRAWSARFSGDELLAYRWQSGGLVARRIAAEDYSTEIDALAPEAIESNARLARVKAE